MIANALGFTVVDVNMRGTGCSGGAFDFFEPLQGLDGYDVIETVARQPWVKGEKVGMMGISYGGISQLFTAATRPPSLAAITPISLIDAVQTTLYPGGILNTGSRLSGPRTASRTPGPPGPARTGPALGVSSASRRAIRSARTTRCCTPRRPTSRRRSARTGPTGPESPIRFRRSRSSTRSTCRRSSPASGRTSRPGGHCPTMASRFTGTDRKWFTFTNGTHVDSLAPGDVQPLV